MESKKGATSANTQKAKGGCLQHNRRTQMPANADPSRTYLNDSWEHERIKNLASTRSLLRRAEKLYVEKVGQKWQKSTAPLKETCVLCKESTTLEDAMKIVRKVEEQTGVVCLGVWTHKDEGHARSRFIPGKPYQCNYHIHILWDCQDPTTGKIIPLLKQHLRDMQDISADSLGMERGNPAEMTGRRHVASLTYKIQMLLKEIEELKKVQIGLLAQIKDKLKYKTKSEELEKELAVLKETHNQDIGKLNEKIEKLAKRADDSEWWKDKYLTERNSAEKENKLLKSQIERLKDKITELTIGKEQEQGRGRKL